MKILVTGVAGFIGSSFLDLALKLGHQVIGLDNFTTGQKNFIQGSISNTNFEFHEVDLLHTKELFKWLEGVDIVYHFAANADIRFGLAQPAVDLQQNIIVTHNLLEAMRICEVKRKNGQRNYL